MPPALQSDRHHVPPSAGNFLHRRVSRDCRYLKEENIEQRLLPDYSEQQSDERLEEVFAALFFEMCWHRRRPDPGRHAKRKNFVERTVRIHLLTNAAYALSARFTVLILQKIFALLKRSHPMFVMDAVSSQNVRC